MTVTRISQQAIVAADGTARVSFDPLDANQRWSVTRLVVSCAGSVGFPAVQIHVISGNESPGLSTLQSGTASGFFDEADYPSGLHVGPGEQLVAIWTGAPPGSVAQVTAQYDEG